MPNNYNKPSYQRKQKLYVENSGSSQKTRKYRALNKNQIENYNISNIPNSYDDRKRKKSKKPFFKFILVALLLTFTATIAYGRYTNIAKDTSQVVDPNLDSPEVEVDVSVDVLEENINILLLGLDKVSYHTDTMLVVNLNTTDGSIEIISIPRDTYCVLPEEVVDEVREDPDAIMPSSGVMKLTEVITYTQDVDKGLEILTDYIGEMLNVELDNYVAVDLDSFSYLIDEIGGVYFDVPQRMYYNDNAQDLHIDLQPGYQLLDGDKAEQLIRFRKGSDGVKGYVDGDIGRTRVQQDFLKALINQVLNTDKVMGDLISLCKTYYKYVTTDIGILDIPTYVSYALIADPDKITTYSLPVEDENSLINGKSYAITVDDEVDILSDMVFYGIMPEVEEEVIEGESETLAEEDIKEEIEEETQQNSDYVITILNGSGKKGFAGKTRDILVDEGYSVEGIGDYVGEKSDTTRLFAKSEGDIEPFISYFDSCEYVYTPGQYEDVVIVLGENETLNNAE